jgi:hypothetical protein
MPIDWIGIFSTPQDTNAARTCKSMMIERNSSSQFPCERRRLTVYLFELRTLLRVSAYLQWKASASLL